MTSLHGHSVLEVSQTHVSLKTAYDGDFATDFRRCQSYISERMERIYPIVEEVSKGDVSFSGIAVKLECPVSSGVDAVEVLREKLVRARIEPSLTDFAAKFTFAIDDRYYVNVSVLNYNQFAGAADEGRVVPAYLELVESGIAIVLDVNDRYAFNMTRGYRSTPDVPGRLMALTQRLIDQVIPRLLTTGEVVL